jgi:hypothetical protein
MTVATASSTAVPARMRAAAVVVVAVVAAVVAVVAVVAAVAVVAGMEVPTPRRARPASP